MARQRPEYFDILERFTSRRGETIMLAPLDFTVPHVLRSDAEYDAAVQTIDALLDAEVAEGTAEWELLRFLSVLIEAYEEERYPQAESLAGGTPQSVVAFMLVQHGLTRADLDPLLGGKGRVSEFFSGKRPLSKSQIVALRDRLGIPADLLLSV